MFNNLYNTEESGKFSKLCYAVLERSSCANGIHKECSGRRVLSKVFLFHLLVLTFTVSGHLWKSWTKTREFSRRLSGLRQNRARINSFLKYDFFLFVSFGYLRNILRNSCSVYKQNILNNSVMYQ